MSAPEGQERRADKKSSLLEHLHNPTHLRFIVTMGVLGIGYAVIYLPLNSSITAAAGKLAESQKRLNLADDVERLRKQFQLVDKRLPKQADADEWMQYVLAAVRRSPLKLDSFSPATTKALGPYQMVYLTIKLSGSPADLDQFLCWLESNERLFRVENVSLTPKSHENGDDLNMEIALLGVMG